jgi:hypothetical protein
VDLLLGSGSSRSVAVFDRLSLSLRGGGGDRSGGVGEEGRGGGSESGSGAKSEHDDGGLWWKRERERKAKVEEEIDVRG